jgi:hypothetical protein
MLRLINHIIIGWGKKLRWLPTSEAELALGKLRIKQCKDCPFGKESRALKLINGHAHYQADVYCSKCGCPVLQKTLVVDEKCPIGKW